MIKKKLLSKILYADVTLVDVSTLKRMKTMAEKRLKNLGEM